MPNEALDKILKAIKIEAKTPKCLELLKTLFKDHILELHPAHVLQVNSKKGIIIAKIQINNLKLFFQIFFLFVLIFIYSSLFFFLDKDCLAAD